MPSPSKIFITGTLLELSARVEEGLPFIPNKLMKTLLENVLARAQTMYPVTIVSYIFLGNHFHILIVVKNPEHVSDFIEYLKRETAYCINKLLGRRKHTVWSDGYDNPVILDPETAMRRLKYIYLNPVAAGLIKEGKSWPLSSASTFSGLLDSSEITVKRIPRNKIPKLPVRNMTIKEIDKVCSSLQYVGDETYTLRVEPGAWLKCYVGTRDRDPRELNELVLLEINNEEISTEKNREGLVPLLSELQVQNIRKPYTPKKFGKRMLCFGKDKNIRVKYIGWVKDLYKQLPRYLKKTKDEILDIRIGYPPGFFAPGGRIFANIVPYFTPFPYLA